MLFGGIEFHSIYVCLQHTTAQPPIEAFMPIKVYTGESAVDVATLNDCIDKIDISSAITVYNALVTNKTEVPADTKQNLLELVAFYNELDPLPKESFEERDHNSTEAEKSEYKKPQWVVGGFADKLFASIEPKTPAAYNTMILGLLKFGQLQQGIALFEEIIEKDLNVDTATYNAIIECQCLVLPAYENRWPTTEKWLRHMSEKQVKPNVHTMNAVLEVIRNSGSTGARRQRALSVLAEFKALNIEPSAGTWYIMLKIFCKERAAISHILVDILDHLGDTNLTAHYKIDTYFFMTAMSVCNMHLNDFQLATRVVRLLNVGQNIKLIGDTYAQRHFYRNYIQLALKTMPWPEFIEIYDDLVPNVHPLELNLCNHIIGKINETGSIEYIPKFWSDMLIADIIAYRSNKTLNYFLDVMCENEPQPDIPAHIGLNERFGECAWNYWEKILNEISTERIANVTSTTLGKLLLLCCRQKKFERATELSDAVLFSKRKTFVTGAVPYAPLKAFVELCIDEKQPTLAIATLKYAVEIGIEESVTLGEIIVDGFTLDQLELRQVTNLIGNQQHRPR